MSYRMITHDIQRFSAHLAAIYANLANPVLDVILYNYQLSENVGTEGLVLLTILVQSSAALCKLFLLTKQAFSGIHSTVSDLCVSAPPDATIWIIYRSLSPAVGKSPAYPFPTC